MDKLGRRRNKDDASQLRANFFLCFLFPFKQNSGGFHIHFVRLSDSQSPRDGSDI